MAGREIYMANLEKVRARIKAMPDRIRGGIGAQLKTEVDGLIELQKQWAPVSKSKYEKHPGQLRDSVHAVPNPDRELSYIIIADAKDEDGRNIGQWVEHGTSEAQAHPFFFPAYRARKRKMHNRIAAAARKAAKQTLPE